jgi:putative intracellular protease/amidase
MKTLLPILGLLLAGQALLVHGADSTPPPPPPPPPAPLPVLLVIANQDFYYQEYGDTRRALEAARLTVKVAAATTTRAFPAPNTGQPAGLAGSVIPDVALRAVDPDNYSAIVFVGGWGASAYQYAYNDPDLDGAIDSYYANSFYNGSADQGKTKAAVNELINDFVAQDKYVVGICHGVSVLAWARVDGVSPLQGRKVASAAAGVPAGFFVGTWYGNNELTLHEHVVVNGGFTNPYSGQFGDPTTSADDVIVDGRIITAENYESARRLGAVLALRLHGGNGRDVLLGGAGSD